MREFHAGTFDIAVIGAGHAGIEAALAAARLGMRTVCFTIDLDAVGNMPCNPAIGGTGKGHLVRELDALGGEMARAADRACIQYRMLNRAKGPAVWSLRAQADRRKYQQVMKHTLERQENLTLRQAEVTEIRCEDGRVAAVVLRTGAVFTVHAAILCTGGDTLLALMRTVGTAELTPVRELTTGAVLTNFVYRGKTYYIISKSGGFGEPDLFCKLAAFVRAGSQKEDAVC